MAPIVGRVFAALLVVVHIGLAAWAVVGVAEMVVAEVPWTRVSNPLFGSGMLALQWGLILVAAGTFVFGYLRRWRHTPRAMAVIYGAMALTCAWQTLLILQHPTRFREMAIEYVQYAVILAFLFGSEHARARFGHNTPPRSTP